MAFCCVVQSNRVWILDAEHVWKSAEILEDFHVGDSALELLLENGAVSKTPAIKMSPQSYEGDKQRSADSSAPPPLLHR